MFQNGRWTLQNNSLGNTNEFCCCKLAATKLPTSTYLVNKVKSTKMLSSHAHDRQSTKRRLHRFPFSNAKGMFDLKREELVVPMLLPQKHGDSVFWQEAIENPLFTSTDVSNPSFLAFHPETGKYVYFFIRTKIFRRLTHVRQHIVYLRVLRAFSYS